MASTGNCGAFDSSLRGAPSRLPEAQLEAWLEYKELERGTLAVPRQGKGVQEGAEAVCGATRHRAMGGRTPPELLLGGGCMGGTGSLSLNAPTR
jgi:hypothetical protein